MVESKIAALLEQRFQEPDLSDCFTVEVALKPGNRLEVAFDSDSGVTFEKCKIVSRFLESHLDTEGWLGEKYMLDVSSPGISRPLVFLRQYPRNVGRTVEVTLADHSVHKGILIAADTETITVEEMMEYMAGRLAGGGEASFFRSVTGFSIARIIACFLALLEMAKQRLVKLRQDEWLGDIHFSPYAGEKTDQLPIEFEAT